MSLSEPARPKSQFQNRKVQSIAAFISNVAYPIFTVCCPFCACGRLPQEHEQYQVNRAFLEHHVSCVAFCHRPNVSRIGYFVDNDSSNKLGKAQASLALTHLIVALECRERHSVYLTRPRVRLRIGLTAQEETLTRPSESLQSSPQPQPINHDSK